MTDSSPYIDPVKLAYYVCAKTGWTISSQRLSYILYIIAMCYAGEKKALLVPNLFEIHYPLLTPVNPVVSERIRYQKIVRQYNISLWPFSIKKPDVEEYGIAEEKREYIDHILEMVLPLTDGHLFGITINGRYDDNGKFIDSGQLSLQDMINQCENARKEKHKK